MGSSKNIILSFLLVASFAIGAAIYFNKKTPAEVTTQPTTKTIEKAEVPAPEIPIAVEQAAPQAPPRIVKSTEPTLPPLPNTPFLASNEPLVPVSAPRNISSETLPDQNTSLDWFQISIGPNAITQIQEDKVFSESRSITNPLSLMIAVGYKISNILGLEFSWAQQFMSGNSSKNKIPKNRMSFGIAWQPEGMIWDTSFLRWGLGIAQEDATFIDGPPNDSRLSNYSKQDLYASMQFNTPMTDQFYLDMKIILSGTAIKPSIFKTYTESGVSLIVTPQYEMSKNLKFGLGLEYTLKQKQLGITNHLSQEDSSDVETKESRASISITYSF